MVLPKGSRVCAPSTSTEMLSDWDVTVIAGPDYAGDCCVKGGTSTLWMCKASDLVERATRVTVELELEQGIVSQLRAYNGDTRNAYFSPVLAAIRDALPPVTG